jgi:hypothetical protein
MFQPGTRVYDVNTKQTGTLKAAPFVSDNAMRMVAKVWWDNGETSCVYTDHIRAYVPRRDQDTPAAAPPAHVTRSGWTFDPSREIWWAKTGPDMWSEVKGAFDDPPKFSPFSPKALEAVRA